MPPPPALARPPVGRLPSGLFPSRQPRPTYREPLPVSFGLVSAGVVGGALWMMLFGLLASTARQYVWTTVVAGVLAWATSLVLGRYGDRGVAVGVALAAGFGVAVAIGVVVARWMGGVWLPW
jgi:hypothetical protein